MKTKIYRVNFGGFDTHSSQANAGDSSTVKHASLLSTVSAALKLSKMIWVFLVSRTEYWEWHFQNSEEEFWGNNSLGTDHGAAAPLFIFGKNVQAGITGNTPLIPDNVTVNDNVPYQYDFRSVYASLLSNLLCVNTTVLNQVMLKDFQQLSITKPGLCNVVTSTNSYQSIHRSKAIDSIVSQSIS